MANISTDFDASVPPSIESKFYYDTSIDALLWNQYFPYQLIILNASKNDTGETVYTPTGMHFTLQISPQELNVSMPIPINTQATLNGISEQHGGAPFRLITLQGTTGVTTEKNHTSTAPPINSAQAIFAGTIQSAQKTASAFTGVINGLGGADLTGKPVNLNTGLGEKGASDSIPDKSTGYYQIRLLRKFIEGYVALKSSTKDQAEGFSVSDFLVNLTTGNKNLNPKNLRLALACWKDESVYLVSPMQFDIRRSAVSPMEYMFTLQLKAWKRIKPEFGGIAGNLHKLGVRDASFYTQVLTRFQSARTTIQNAQKTVRSISFESVNVLNETLREGNLFLKDSAGLVGSIIDFPEAIVLGCVGVLRNNLDTVRLTGTVITEKMATLISGASFDYQTPRPAIAIGPIPLSKGFKINVGARLDLAAYGEDFRNMLANIQVTQLPLPSSLSAQINREKSRVRGFKRLDFEKQRNSVLRFAAEFANAIGAGDEIYNDTYNLPTSASTRTPTDDEFTVLFALNELAQNLDYLASTGYTGTQEPTSVEYVAGLAERSGIAFKIPQSKFSVPFPYGFTLERLALQYLGDANRWQEIATLNGLRAPYIDEEGFTKDFTTNGDGRNLYVFNKENLFIGQTIWISSDTVAKVKRHITNITEISLTNFMITVDGDADLDLYQTSDKARIEAFLPGTVNSQQVIYIPSEAQAGEDPKTKSIPGIDVFDPLLQVSGVDLLLTQSGDLAITPDGDCRLAYGLANIVQSVKIALATPKGSLLQHPEFGLSVPVGSSTADVDPKDLLKTAQEMFSNDPTFTGINSAVITKNGPVLQMTLDVGVSGINQNIPITINLT